MMQTRYIPRRASKHRESRDSYSIARWSCRGSLATPRHILVVLLLHLNHSWYSLHFGLCHVFGVN
jgi:hypothetical protein